MDTGAAGDLAQPGRVAAQTHRSGVHHGAAAGLAVEGQFVGGGVHLVQHHVPPVVAVHSRGEVVGGGEGFVYAVVRCVAAEIGEQVFVRLDVAEPVGRDRPEHGVGDTAHAPSSFWWVSRVSRTASAVTAQLPAMKQDTYRACGAPPPAASRLVAAIGASAPPATEASW